MSYAAPFYYAAKAVQSHEQSPHHHQIKRRRRIKLVLFPAQRIRRTKPQAATASADC